MFAYLIQFISYCYFCRKAHRTAGPPGPRGVPGGGQDALREGRGVLRGEHGAHGRNTGKHARAINGKSSSAAAPKPLILPGDR